MNLYGEPGVVHSGTLHGFDFKILSMGAYPTAYVRVPEGHKYYDCEYDEVTVDVHGGITFSGKMRDEDPKSFFIGWDYAHLGDFFGQSIGQLGGGVAKKWTLQEVLGDVNRAIKQLGDSE